MIRVIVEEHAFFIKGYEVDSSQDERLPGDQFVADLYLENHDLPVGRVSYDNGMYPHVVNFNQSYEFLYEIVNNLDEDFVDDIFRNFEQSESKDIQDILSVKEISDEFTHKYFDVKIKLYDGETVVRIASWLNIESLKLVLKNAKTVYDVEKTGMKYFC